METESKVLESIRVVFITSNQSVFEDLYVLFDGELAPIWASRGIASELDAMICEEAQFPISIAAEKLFGGYIKPLFKQLVAVRLGSPDPAGWACERTDE